MELVIANMACGHCKMTIETALKEAGVKDFIVDLETKRVIINSKELSEKKVRKLIQSKGYEVK